MRFLSSGDFLHHLPTLILLFHFSMLSSGETRGLTEDYVRRAGIVPSKQALQLLMSTSISTDKKMTQELRHNFREARYNSQLKPNVNLDTDKTVDEMCAVSSTLTCGKKVLKGFAAEDGSSVHDRCTARQEFLECLSENRSACRDLAERNELPYLPSDSVIKDAQSRISQALWTSGGCLLS